MATMTKICGITNVKDALFAASAGADLIGLNFYEKSKRYIAPADAQLIAREIRGKVRVAGVFVNASAASISQISESVGLDFVQLHGDEEPALWAEVKTRLPDAKLIRAIRVFDSDWETALRQSLIWKDAGAEILLFDAGSDADYGGTGESLDWEKFTSLKIARPWLLAGGLTPSNVADAIKLAKPDGVDVASGVETTPGNKDSQLVEAFIRSASSMS